MFLMAVNQASNNDKLVTDMQDKFTEIQQHEIEFLNNFITHLGWIFGVVATIVSLIVVYIGYANRQAEKKMKEAEQVLGAAQALKDELLQYKADLEEYRETTEKEFKELTKLVNSQEIADLKANTEFLSIRHRIDSLLFHIQDIVNKGQDTIWNLRQELNNSSVALKIENSYLEIKDEMKVLKNGINKGIYDIHEAELLLLKTIHLENKAIEVEVSLKEFIHEVNGG